MGTVGLLLAVAFVSLILLSMLTRLLRPKPHETVEIEVVGSGEDLAHRERIRTIVADLNLGYVRSLRNAKTGKEFMRVSLDVPRAVEAIPRLQQALAGEPVRIRSLGFPLDMSLITGLRRITPGVKEELLRSWWGSGGE